MRDQQQQLQERVGTLEAALHGLIDECKDVWCCHSPEQEGEPVYLGHGEYSEPDWKDCGECAGCRAMQAARVALTESNDSRPVIDPAVVAAKEARAAEKRITGLQHGLGEWRDLGGGIHSLRSSDTGSNPSVGLLGGGGWRAVVPGRLHKTFDTLEQGKAAVESALTEERFQTHPCCPDCGLLLPLDHKCMARNDDERPEGRPPARPNIESEVSASVPASSDGFRVGDSVEHPEWGSGSILRFMESDRAWCVVGCDDGSSGATPVSKLTRVPEGRLPAHVEGFFDLAKDPAKLAERLADRPPNIASRRRTPPYCVKGCGRYVTAAGQVCRVCTEDGFEARKEVCPDCGHFLAAHRPNEGCSRRNCPCTNTGDHIIVEPSTGRIIGES